MTPAWESRAAPAFCDRVCAIADGAAAIATVDIRSHTRAVPAALLIVMLLCMMLLPATPSRGQPRPVEPAEARCDRVNALAGAQADATVALQACIDATPSGAVVALAPGRYRVAGALTLSRPVTLTTRFLSAQSPGCKSSRLRCATLVVQPAAGSVPAGAMPITVRSDNVTLDHLVIAGGTKTAPCAGSTTPAAGGMRVGGDRFRLTHSVLTGFTCYTSLEYLGGADGLVSGNLFLGNGTHTIHGMWSDGLTIHDARGLRVIGNRFVDNTDVQLIFGGCTGCTVSGNTFRHSGAAAGGSFAELMIQAWPHATSGRYDGSTFSRNDIDCGAAKRCGFGILVGSNPWYDAPVSGGTITGNRIANAMLGLDVEDLDGPVTFGPNHVAGVVGRYPASCGPTTIANPVNVSAPARSFVRGAVPADATDHTLRHCILNWSA